MDQHPNLFGADAETELPALVAPRVTAPVKAAPKAQPIALDLFPATGLFADQDDAEADQADEDAALADDQGDLADLADALREEAAELPAMREDSLAATARAMVRKTGEKRAAAMLRADLVECVPVGTPAELVDALVAQHAEEAPGVTAAFRLLAEAAEALDARAFRTLDSVEATLMYRQENEGDLLRRADWLLLGLVEGRGNRRAFA